MNDEDVSRVWDIMEQTRYSDIPVTRYDKRKQTRSHRHGDPLGHHPIWDYPIDRGIDEGGRPSTKVRSLMRTPAITISPKALLADAIELMLAQHWQAPVVEEGNLVGIVVARHHKGCMRGDEVRRIPHYQSLKRGPLAFKSRPHREEGNIMASPTCR